MKLKIYRFATVILVTLALALMYIYLRFPELHVYALQKQVEYQNKIAGQESIIDLMRQETDIVTKVGDENLVSQLRVELPSDVSVKDVEVVNDYVNHMIDIRIPGADNSYIYDYPLIGSCDNITDIKYGVAASTAELAIELDGVYLVQARNIDRYIYIDFLSPRDVYDEIVVVDAGHGGKDVGASSQGINEKDIDLLITEKMCQYFEQMGEAEDADSFVKQNVTSYMLNDKRVGVFYTRKSDIYIPVQSRSALANALGADLFISVHNNSTASGRMSTINGTEVMYRASDVFGQSKNFAEMCLNGLLWNLGSTSKGLVAGDDIYIIRTAQMPVALVEVGFMSNQDELNKLCDDEYQNKTAVSLCETINNALQIYNNQE